jgi:epoxyqueuosine reductase
VATHPPAAKAAKAAIAAQAKALGFDLVGFTSAEPFDATLPVFEERVAAGMLGQWRYTRDDLRLRCTPALALEGAKSIVCTATSYLGPERPHDPYAPGLMGAVSSHSWGRDYHRVIGERLRALGRFISETFDGARTLPCVDTGPLVDRAAAVRAGIGWFGKNGNVLTKEFGSWVLLGELLTTLELEPDARLATNCGLCQVCVERCPTGAIGADGSVDARLCISDLTQRKTPIPRELRAGIGNRLWGCDDCQTPCPVNERKETVAAAALRTEAFAPLPHVGRAMHLPSVLRMTKSQFKAWFGQTSMAWRGKAVLQRNAAVALGNSRDRGAVVHLIAALDDRKPLVRGHAAWALGRLGGDDARAALAALLEREPDPWVREETELAIAELRT